MTPQQIIIENERRKRIINEPFDPISGKGSIGERFQIYRDGSQLFLPVAMKATPALETMPQEQFEHLRACHDFPFWAAKFVYIKSKGGGDDRLFTLNRPQRKVIARFEEQRLAGKPIRVLLLKARQWGASTCVQIYMAWLQLTQEKGLNSLIIAHQRVASDEIKDMFDRLIANYPEHLLQEEQDLPKRRGKKEKKKKFKKMEGVGLSGATSRIPARKCKIKIGSAEQPDSCRGGDYNLVHCSEVGIWKQTAGKSPDMIARAACAGILLTPLTMIVYESTANGTGNFFHREYEAARAGTSQFMPIFVPWYEIEQYSLPLTDPLEMAENLLKGRFEEGALSDRSQPGAYLWWLWEKGATLEAIAWYQSERSKYSDHGLMASEYPSDDVEAFVHSGSNVFDKYKVEELRPDCCPPKFSGEISTSLQPLEGIIPDAPFMRRQLQEVEFHTGPGAWKIWAPPEFSSSFTIPSRYVAVVDVGGRDPKSDWSVIAIFDREPMIRRQRPEVVAQWRGHTDFDMLAWTAALAASLYDDALLVIESNSIESRDPARNTDGDQSSFLFNRLRDIYANLYARRPSEEAVNLRLPTKYGFHTNAATKPTVIATLVKAIRERLYVERDEECLNEYLVYERRQNGSFGAIPGCHDDLLMTRAIGLHLILHELPAPLKRPIAPRDSSTSMHPLPMGYSSY